MPFSINYPPILRRFLVYIGPILRVSYQNSQILTYHCRISRPLAPETRNPWTTVHVRRCLCVPKFSRFDTKRLPFCDRRTDGLTDRQTDKQTEPHYIPRTTRRQNVSRKQNAATFRHVIRIDSRYTHTAWCWYLANEFKTATRRFRNLAKTSIIAY